LSAETTWKQTRGKLARRSRDLPPGHPEIVKLRTDLKVDRAAEYIQKLLDEAPTLDDAQRNRLAELLRPVRVRPVVEMVDVRNVEQEAATS